MRLKSSHPSRLRWRLLAGAAMLAPVAPGVALAQDGVLVIDSTGASVQRERAPALLSAADGFSAGYDNGAVVVDLSVLDGGQAANQPIRLRPPPVRRTIAAAPPSYAPPSFAPRQNQLAVAPPLLQQPAQPYRGPRLRLPPRRPVGLSETVQLAVAPPQQAYRPPPAPKAPAAVARPRSFSPSSVSLAPPPRLVASAPPPKPRANVRATAEAPLPPIRRRKPVPPPPAAPAPVPLSVALPPALPERQPQPRPSPAAPPSPQAPLVRIAPQRPSLPPAASIRTPAAPPAPIKFAPPKAQPAYKPVQPRGQAPAAVLSLPPKLPVRNAPAAPPPPALTERPNMAAPKLPAPNQADRRLPASVSAPPPVPAPPPASNGLVTPLPLPPLPQAQPAPSTPSATVGLGPLERADRDQLAGLPPKAPVRPAAPLSQVRQIAALPAAEPQSARPLNAPSAPSAPPVGQLAPPPIEQSASTRPMARSNGPQLAALPPELRLEQARPVPAMAEPRLPAPPPAEALMAPIPPRPVDSPPPMQMASAQELLGGNATSGIEASDALKARFPIIFDRQDPPAMAQPGWTPAAPAATIAAAKPVNLAPLGSLAPPQQPVEPRRQLAALPAPAPVQRSVEPAIQLPSLTSRPLPNLVQQPNFEPRSFNGVAQPRQTDGPRIVRPRLAPPSLPSQRAPELASPTPLPPAPGVRQAPQAFPKSPPRIAAVQQSEPRGFNGVAAPDGLPPASLIQPPPRRVIAPAGPLPQPVATTFAEPDFEGITQPGSAVLAPPPPPAQAPEIAARPESQSALPVPAAEVSNQAPRRGLSIPDALARVTPPQQSGSEAPRRLLTPPPMDDLSKAPGFAPLPLPAPIAPPVAEAPPQNVSPVPPPRLSELTPPARQTTFTAPIAAAQDFSTEIAFTGGSRSLPGDAMPALAAIADRMKANPGLHARVSGAAAAGDPGEAQDVALARALAVQRYLLSRGVLSDAIKVQPVSGDQGRNGVSVTLVEPV